MEAVPGRLSGCSEAPQRCGTRRRIQARVVHQVGRKFDVLHQIRIVVSRLESVIVRHLTLTGRGELVQARLPVGREERLVRVTLWTRPPVMTRMATLLPIRIPWDTSEEYGRARVRFPSGLTGMIRIPDLSPSMSPEEEEHEQRDGGQAPDDPTYERSDGDARSINRPDSRISSMCIDRYGSAPLATHLSAPLFPSAGSAVAGCVMT